MSIYDEIFENPNLNDSEKVERFLEIASELNESPMWTGTSMPNLPKIRDYLRAKEISEKLFANSFEAEIINDDLTPYQDSSGGVVYVWSGSDPNIASMVFKNRKANLLVSEFLSLVDSITITAEHSLRKGRPGFVIAVRWVVFDTMIGDFYE